MNIEKEVIDCVNDLVKKVICKEYNTQYWKKNKKQLTIKKKQYQKEYREKNRDKNKQYQKEYKIKYNKTPQAKKSKRISQWKRKGIITDDYDALYEHYLKTAYCDCCRVELTYDRCSTATTKCVDHDHKIRDAPNFRNILCNSCNVKRR
jgi:hypothetical protein